MIKALLDILNPGKYVTIIALIIGLLSWHYGSVYFAKQSGKKEQQELIDRKNNDIIKKQEKQNAKDNADVDATDVATLRNSLPRRKADSDMSGRIASNNVQRGGSRGDGRQISERFRKTSQSVESSYKRLCEQAGCESGCQSVSFDVEYGPVGVCK